MAGRERLNQQKRTRNDLLKAASALLQSGKVPSLEAVAAEANVSRATAYRYFPNIDALMVEASVDIQIPSPESVFNGFASTDPSERLRHADASLDKMLLENELTIRAMLSQLVLAGGSNDEGLARQDRRTPLIRRALEPCRDQFSDEGYAKLVRALALLFGPEAMIVCKDVLRLDENDTEQIKTWAISALVAAASKS